MGTRTTPRGPGTTRARIYWTLAKMGAATRARLRTQPDLMDRHNRDLDHVLKTMVQDGSLSFRDGLFEAVPGAMRRDDYALLTERAMDELADCAAGVTDALLRTELGVCQAELRMLMGPLLEAGRARRVQLGPEPGYRLPAEDAASDLPDLVLRLGGRSVAISHVHFHNEVDLARMAGKAAIDRLFQAREAADGTATPT